MIGFSTTASYTQYTHTHTHTDTQRERERWRNHFPLGRPDRTSQTRTLHATQRRCCAALACVLGALAGRFRRCVLARATFTVLTVTVAQRRTTATISSQRPM